MSERGMTEREFKALDKVFWAEISGRLPFQSKAKIYAELEEKGLVRKGTSIFGDNTRFPMTVNGWELTSVGRYAFCLNASKKFIENCAEEK